jgi:nitroreductase
VALGRDAAPAGSAPPVGPLELPTQRLSPSQVDYPAITEMHRASSLHTGAEARAWRTEASPAAPAPAWPFDEPLDSVIRRRGSARRFLRDPIPLPQLEAILAYAAPPDPLCGIYLIINAVDGLSSGTYYVAGGRIELLRAGDFRDSAAYLDLGQELAGDAAVNVYSLCNLDQVVASLGDRGYRAAQLEGGIHGGKLYLAAYALGLGATGLTFFDDDVIRFFSPHAAGKSVMFLTAIGVPARRRAAQPA